MGVFKRQKQRWAGRCSKAVPGAGISVALGEGRVSQCEEHGSANSGRAAPQIDGWKNQSRGRSGKQAVQRPHGAMVGCSRESGEVLGFGCAELRFEGHGCAGRATPKPSTYAATFLSSFSLLLEEIPPATGRLRKFAALIVGAMGTCYPPELFASTQGGLSSLQRTTGQNKTAATSNVRVGGGLE